MENFFTRRVFLKAGLSGAAVLALPIGCTGLFGSKKGTEGQMPSKQPDPGRFFDSNQLETVRALTGVLIPEDEDPGAISAGAVDYIDFLLGAFTVYPPRIYAAGPFSGRHGGGSDGFRAYLPLSRVKEIGWRNYIEGSLGMPEREFNGPVVGLQQIYTQGIDQLNSLAQDQYGAAFKDLDFPSQQNVVKAADDAFRSQALSNTVEGMYSLPEYGGNLNMMGWKYIGYEGDRQPIGYNRKQMEEADPGGFLSQDELKEAAEFVKQVFKRFEDQSR